jgi:hypothetical protein
MLSPPMLKRRYPEGCRRFSLLGKTMFFHGQLALSKLNALPLGERAESVPSPSIVALA